MNKRGKNMKLKKVNSTLYATDDLLFTMKKEILVLNGRIYRIWKLYKDGCYIGRPQTVKQANEWIKND